MDRGLEIKYICHTGEGSICIFIERSWWLQWLRIKGILISCFVNSLLNRLYTTRQNTKNKVGFSYTQSLLLHIQRFGLCDAKKKETNLL